jgi:hypothetical protein
MHRPATIVCALAEGTPPQVAEVAAWLARELDLRIVLTHAFDAMAIQVPAAGRLAMAGITTNELAAPNAIVLASWSSWPPSASPASCT